jgi:hypothetical protein
LLIAALAHDIERAFRAPDYSGKFNKSEKGFRDEGHLIHHQKRGAEIIAAFLKKQNADAKLIERVKMLISKHEVGGNREQDLLKDADSVSFFENNVEYFVSDIAPKLGTRKVKDKFDWMFDRVTFRKAKETARPWYEDAIKQLGY